MASFMNDVSKSSFNANEKVINFTNGRTRTASGVTQSSGQINSPSYKPGTAASSDYSVVGMRTAGIPIIQQLIRDYVTEVENVLDGFNTEAKVSQAIRGTEMEAAVANYVEKVSQYTKSLCTYLLAFNDKLSDVQKAWEAAVADMAQTVNSGMGDLEGASTRYTEGQA